MFTEPIESLDKNMSETNEIELTDIRLESCDDQEVAINKSSKSLSPLQEITPNDD